MLIENVKSFRESSNRESTKRASLTPSLFGAPFECKSDYIALPKVSSERRFYIPIDYLSSNIIPGDKLFVMENATLFHCNYSEPYCPKIMSGVPSKAAFNALTAFMPFFLAVPM